MIHVRDEHRSATVARSGEAVSIVAGEQGRNLDFRVSIILLALLMAAALQIQVSGVIGDNGAHRHGIFAQALDLVLNFGVGVGMSLLLLSGRSRSDRNGAN